MVFRIKISLFLLFWFFSFLMKGQEILSYENPYPGETLNEFSIYEVDRIEDMYPFIQEKCPYLKYDKGSKKLDLKGQLSLMKILKNLGSFEKYTLFIYVNSDNEKLDKKRMNRIQAMCSYALVPDSTFVMSRTQGKIAECLCEEDGISIQLKEKPEWKKKFPFKIIIRD